MSSGSRRVNRLWCAGISAIGAVASGGGTAAGQTCYANCNGSTVPPVININDFTCFMARYTAGDSYANCDRSTIPPVLNIHDFVCFLNSYAAGCPTEPMANGGVAREMLLQAREQRVALVRLGDSNQLRGGHGWDHGFQKAASDRYGLYATPLISHNENYGLGAGIGYRCQALTQGSVVGSVQGPTPAWSGFLDFAGGGTLTVHKMASISGVVPSTISSGILLFPDWPGDVDGPLRYSTWTGRFTLGGGSFRPGWNSSGLVQMYGPGPFVTGPSVVEGMVRVDTDLEAGPRGAMLRAGPNVGGYSDIVGPYLATYQCISNRARLTGVSSHTLFSGGGQSLYNYAVTLRDSPDKSIAHFFECVGDLMKQVGQRRQVIILLDSGLNDRNATGISIGAHPAISSTAAGYADNARAIVDRIRGVLLADGWGPDEFCFVLSASHPVDDNPWAYFEWQLTQYRSALEAMAMTDGDVGAIDLSRLTTASEMRALGYYNNGGLDTDHLVQKGYEDLAGRILDAIAR